MNKDTAIGILGCVVLDELHPAKLADVLDIGAGHAAALEREVEREARTARAGVA